MIHLTSVSKKFGPTNALSGLDLHIPRGRITGLLGPNGAGKSTTLKLILGIIKPDAGTITVDGLEPSVDPLGVRARIGYLPEIVSLFEHLSGREFLELIGTLRQLDRDRVRSRLTHLAQFFELESELDRPVAGYSKGMAQKIAWSAALLADPPLLLLDEPLSGLDANATLRVRELLLTLKGTGTTVLYSSHLLEVVERVCDQVAILHQGELVAQGTVEEVMRGQNVHTLAEAFVKLTGGIDPRTQAQDLARELMSDDGGPA